jgi:hypothetical protein
MDFIKHFCRLITKEELSNDDVVNYFDIVQSVCPSKIVKAYSNDGTQIEANVTVYEADNDKLIYEIVLEQQLDINEGEDIADEIAEEFPDLDFEYETSLEF